jgi:hypothetical protein
MQRKLFCWVASKINNDEQAFLVWFRSKILDKISLTQTVNTHILEIVRINHKKPPK